MCDSVNTDLTVLELCLQLVHKVIASVCGQRGVAFRLPQLQLQHRHAADIVAVLRRQLLYLTLGRLTLVSHLLRGQLHGLERGLSHLQPSACIHKLAVQLGVALLQPAPLQHLLLQPVLQLRYLPAAVRQRLVQALALQR